MQVNNQSCVGVIGLGIIGSRVAANLRAAGFDTVVWSRTPRDEPGFVSSIGEAAGKSRMIQIFVSDDQALGQVMDGILPTLGPEHVVCCHSTVSPGAVKQAAEQVSRRGAGFVEAPFTGSRDAAAAGRLAFYVAGDPAAVARARPVLQVNAAHLIDLGSEIGGAAVLKIATNMISATTVCVLAEALALTRACGVDDGDLARALSVNGCRSPLVDMKLPGMMTGDYSPHFSLDNMLKDARFALELALSSGVDLEVLAAAADRLGQGSAAGAGALDYSAVMLQFEQAGA